MEFLRRNWVDLLMALLIAAVIAAVLFLLLSGGKLFKPATNTVTNTPSNVSTPVATSPSNTTKVVVPPSSTTKPNSPEIPANSAKPKPPSQPVAVTKPSSSSITTKPTSKPTNKPTSKSLNSKTINVPEIPAIGSNTKPAKPNKPSIVQKPTVQKPVVTSTKPKTPIAKTSASMTQPKKVTTPVKNTSKPRATIAKTSTPTTRPSKPTKPATPPVNTNTTTSRTSYLSSYRIVVGSYKTQPRAETFAAQVRSQGFPARAVLSQGLYLVIVGPYSRSSSAESVFARLKNTYPGATLYRPNGSRSSGFKKTTTPRKVFEGSSSKPATLNSTLAKQPIKTSKTAVQSLPKKNTTDPKIETAYLQVGSFRNAASASPLLINLRKAGYSARLRVASNGVTRVIIGPLTGTPLELARSDLRARGLQPFTIR
jgi:cell division protein FtsN